MHTTICVAVAFADIGVHLLHDRFFIHKSIEAFAAAIVHRYGKEEEQAYLFPSHAIASRCLDFLRRHVCLASSKLLRIVDLVMNPTMTNTGTVSQIPLKISAVIFPGELAAVAKTFWQHTGDGLSSRQAEFCHKAFTDGSLVDQSNAESEVNGTLRLCKGPRRYQRVAAAEQTQAHLPAEHNEGNRPPDSHNLDGSDYTQFVEERFGRNLDLSFVKNAKLAIRRRIAGSLTAKVDLKEALEVTDGAGDYRKVKGFSERDVYLYSSGMSSIFNTHRTLMVARGLMKSICFG